ncbi:MAG: hypothetical protein JSR85_07755 [Proteobacteria bacterium]|nr:hypothetical protein [Pseudomonadota bacterium]
MRHSQRRRGRPRINIPCIDKGTEELQRKRKKLLENALIRDVSLSESFLGLLYAHQVIPRPLYEAGKFFGELGYRYEPCLGHTFRARANVLIRNRYGSVPVPDSFDKKRTDTWRSALQILKSAGTQSYKTVMQVVFYDQELFSTDLNHLSLREKKWGCPR